MSTSTDHPTYSFVYPVRSLLAGNILPAQAAAPFSPSKSIHNGSGVSQPLLGTGASGRDTDRCPSPPHTKFQDIRGGFPPVDHGMSQRRRRRSAERAGRDVSPNFRHYPGGDAPTRSFVTVPVPMPTKIIVSPQSTSPTGDSGLGPLPIRIWVRSSTR